MFFAAVSCCMVLLCAIPAEAQRGPNRPSGPGGGGPRRPPPKKPPKDRPSGSEQGRLIKFKPAKESSEDEDLLGVLSVKAFGNDKKVVRMLVRRSDDLKVRVRDHVFDTEELGDVLWKGLYCTASWRLDNRNPNRKRKKKELQGLSFDTLDVEGTVYQIDDGMVVVKGVPRGGRQWPDVQAKGRSGPNGRPGNRPRRVIRRKLKLKVLEDVTTFLDASGDEMGLDDFEIGQEVEATVVYGRPYGMVVAMRIPSDGSGSNDDRGDDRGSGRGNPPAGPSGPGGGLPGGGGGRGGRGGGRG